MMISIIVAVSENQVIGRDNQLPWHLPADLKYFKTLTTGHTIVMGRNTYDSIGKPLPNRENVVITRNADFNPAGVKVVHSLEDALKYCSLKEEEVFIIGGDSIYRQAINFVSKIYLTRVHCMLADGNAFFPRLDASFWGLKSSTFYPKDEKNEYDYSFEVYERIAKEEA